MQYILTFTHIYTPYVHTQKHIHTHTLGWNSVCTWYISTFAHLHISFAEYRLFYRALLQKRPRILRSLLYTRVLTYIIQTHSRTHIYMHTRVEECTVWYILCTWYSVFRKRDTWVVAVKWLQKAFSQCRTEYLYMILVLCLLLGNPQTDEIRLKLITTAKIFNQFSQESPYISNMFLGSPQIFKQGFFWVNGVPVTQERI